VAPVEVAPTASASWADEMTTPVTLDPETYEAPDGSVIPPGMIFPTAEVLLEAIGAVEGASSKGKEIEGAEADEEVVSKHADSKAHQAAPGSEGTNDISDEPEAVGGADVADLFEAIARSKVPEGITSAGSVSDDGVPAPSDVMVVTGEIKRVEAKIDDVSAKMAQTNQLVSSLHEVVMALKTDNAALTSALSTLTTEMHRVRNLEPAISAQETRAEEKLASSSVLSDGEEIDPSIRAIRQSLLSLEPGQVATGGPSTAGDAQVKPTLFRDY